MSQAPERRHFWRSLFDSPVRVDLGGRMLSARLLDLSLKGALLEVGPLWDGGPSQPCQLHLVLGEDVAIDMRCSVAFLAGNHAGLRCEAIDLESITHLRRLLELNSGAEHSLERDLANLVA